MKSVLIVLLILTSATRSLSQVELTGQFVNSKDIGNPKLQGSVLYNPDLQEYILKGSGYNIWFDRDEFHYAYKPIQGDFILTANFEFRGEGVDPHRKIGWMVRESLDEDASHVSATLHGDGLTSLQWRVSKGAQMRDPEDQIESRKNQNSILQLERKGNVITMKAANIGEPLQVVGEHSTNYGDEVLVGLFISSHNEEVIEEAIVWNVRLDNPVDNDYNPYDNGFLGCRLETINVFNGKRKVIYTSNGRFEAPNWMPSGDQLIFNMNGSLYTISDQGGEITKHNTGFANDNNNDHGISFDGKLLAISHHREGLPGGGSTIYVLPIEGGEPKQVTELTPSYWHGWNPNNEEVLYVAKRSEDEPYNIYKASIKDGKEEAVTTFSFGHVDGPEFSPDGKYIYYNGSQSGTMQLWRMKPDATEKEQLTFDQYNSWFPHISPDGKWIAYMNFIDDIPADSHPSYKRITLNLMPVDGGQSRVIAYLYGGQGTINVPSWSPDSKQIAFVSNSGK